VNRREGELRAHHRDPHRRGPLSLAQKATEALECSLREGRTVEVR
jgi:hypothetical protein